MNQKLSLSLFFGGLATFLMSLGEFFSSHPSWQSMNSPMEIGHIIIMTASFCSIIAGAIGIQIPRSKDSNFTDRVTDIKLSEINQEGSQK